MMIRALSAGTMRGTPGRWRRLIPQAAARRHCAVSSNSSTPSFKADATDQAQKRKVEEEAGNTETHFGFSRVPISEKQTLVGQVFASVAPSYDVMNDAMSLGVHRLWKSAFVADMAPVRGMRILDCAGGTADIALRIASATGSGASVVVADVNPDMLAVGKARIEKAGISSKAVRFVEANAENLPFADGEFDVYAISFGMRNVPRADAALREAFRVLKKGGRFMMLEFARVDSAPVAAAYDAYSFNVIPAIGRLVAGDEAAYRYLVESIREFPGQEEFLGMVKAAGFVNATVTDYSMGIAAVYSAFRPVSR